VVLVRALRVGLYACVYVRACKCQVSLAQHTQQDKDTDTDTYIGTRTGTRTTIGTNTGTV